MFAKKSVFRILFVLFIALMISGTASARPLDAALGTGFAYQGKLTDGGAPANGTYDFEFKLYDALSGGNQVGSTVTKDDVTVTAGLFTVQLDFGNVFDGTALYLEVGVRPGANTGVYTPLTARQALSATPYASYAGQAPWSGITGMPAGFSDNVDDNTIYTAGDGLELAGTQFKGKGTSYQNVVIVAKSGGDFTSIQAALDSITDASDTNRYLVYVAPGVYTERVTMKQYVDIEGAGELTTKITFTGSPTDNAGTVMGASNAEIRFLGVENTGENTYAIAINNNAASTHLIHVTATAAGGTDYDIGIFNKSSSPILSNVTAAGSGGSLNFGVYNYLASSKMSSVTAIASGGASNVGVINNNSSPTMVNVTATGTGGTFGCGVQNTSSPSLVTMTNVIATASDATANYGVRVEASNVTIMSVTATATGGTSSYGVYISNSSPAIQNSTISASGGTNNYGIYNTTGSGTVQVNNSQISGGTNTIRNNTEYTTRVGASQLNGGGVDISAGGTLTCAGVYDENYVFYASTCP